MCSKGAALVFHKIFSRLLTPLKMESSGHLLAQWLQEPFWQVCWFIRKAEALLNSNVLLGAVTKLHTVPLFMSVAVTMSFCWPIIYCLTLGTQVQIEVYNSLAFLVSLVTLYHLTWIWMKKSLIGWLQTTFARDWTSAHGFISRHADLCIVE